MLPPVRCLLAANEHGTYCIPLDMAHRPAPQCTLRGEVWEAETLCRIRDHAALTPDRDIVDAGAYFGDFLPALSRCLAPGARVWTVEPNADSFACARWTIELNRLTNVELSSVALGERAHRGRVRVRDGGAELGGASTIVGDDAAVEREDLQEVDVVTLDSLVAGRPVSVIHFDVEDYTAPALAGAMATIEAHRPLIIVEHDLADSAVKQALHALGYRRTGEVDKNSVYEAV
ncbi:MAG: FkbM family methyltransferase [Hyphomicrobiales bacterium]